MKGFICRKIKYFLSFNYFFSMVIISNFPIKRHFLLIKLQRFSWPLCIKGWIALLYCYIFKPSLDFYLSLDCCQILDFLLSLDFLINRDSLFHLSLFWISFFLCESIFFFFAKESWHSKIHFSLSNIHPIPSFLLGISFIDFGSIYQSFLAKAQYYSQKSKGLPSWFSVIKEKNNLFVVIALKGSYLFVIQSFCIGNEIFLLGFYESFWFFYQNLGYINEIFFLYKFSVLELFFWILFFEKALRKYKKIIQFSWKFFINIVWALSKADIEKN